jgi:hypothetical protein
MASIGPRTGMRTATRAQSKKTAGGKLRLSRESKARTAISAIPAAIMIRMVSGERGMLFPLYNFFDYSLRSIL